MTKPSGPRRILFVTGMSGAGKKTALKANLLSGQTSNYYWTQAWNAYLGTPNTTNTTTVTTRLKDLLLEVTRLAEHQLA